MTAKTGGAAPVASGHPALVSVVVPTHNNSRTVEATLQSVRGQSYPAIELIVVDNHSTDETFAIAQRLADLAIQAGPERSAQRNAGIARAAGSWILWLDSDMILPGATIEVAMNTALHTGAHGVALPERTIGQGYWTACRALERACYLDQPGLHNPRLIQRSILTGGGGFNTTMSGPEDADLRLRMRAADLRVELAPIIVDHDEGRLTVREVMRKRYYYGRSLPAFEQAHHGATSQQGRDLLRAYLAHSHELLSDPVHTVGMLSLRALELVGYRLGARRGARDTAQDAR